MNCYLMKLRKHTLETKICCLAFLKKRKKAYETLEGREKASRSWQKKLLSIYGVKIVGQNASGFAPILLSK